MNPDRARWLARGAWLLAAAEVVIAVREHISGRLSEKQRRRMVEIVRASKGRPSNLSSRVGWVYHPASGQIWAGLYPEQVDLSTVQSDGTSGGS